MGQRAQKGGFSYSYRAPVRIKYLKSLKANSRHILIILVSVVLIFTFSTIASRITGFVLYSNDLELQLNETMKTLNILSREKAECSAALSTAGQNLDTCNSKLSSSNSFLVGCEKDLGDSRSYADNLNSLFSACDRERKDFSEKLVNKTSDYKEIVRNSVKAICCSFGDSAAGTARNWEITANQIVCSGNFTVNCTSGKTDF